MIPLVNGPGEDAGAGRRPPRRPGRLPGDRATLAALFLAGLACAAPARVFERTPGSGDGAVSAGQPGWNLAYETTLRINDGRGRMEVVGCDFRMDEALASLDQTYRAMGATVFLMPGARLAWGLVVRGDRVTSLLLTALTPGRACILFRLEQSRDEFRRSLQPPAESRLKAVPDTPGGRPRLFVADEGTNTALEISESAMGREEAERYLESTLVATGWRPLLTPDPRVGARPLVLYARGREIGAFQVSGGNGAPVRVTRIYKRTARGE